MLGVTPASLAVKVIAPVVSLLISNVSTRLVFFNSVTIDAASVPTAFCPVNVTDVVVALPFLSNVVTEYVDYVPSIAFTAAVLNVEFVAGSSVRLPAALLLTDTCTLLPDCEPSSNFIVLNSVVSEILVNSL